MIVSKECNEFKGKYVGIGIQDIHVPGKLFFYYGTLIDIDNKSVKIKLNNGYKQIFLDDIEEIKLALKK
jgi:hypothetical protein